MDSETRYRVVAVELGADSLRVRLDDGREVSIGYGHFPRLARATAEQRANWTLIGNGTGISWPELDEDVSAWCIVHLHETAPSREPHEGDAGVCRICGRPGRWIHPHPSVDAQWLEPRCAAHTPEDDYA